MLSCNRRIMYVFAIAALFGVVHSRAVNISNTWMLPEEGFPVFYRYFRDRISWYEADAVCQFHHANLVTADTSSQYDAIRAYLKELDIAEKVWIGLSKTPEKPKFIWTDFHTLSGEGHWQDSLPTGDSQSLCAVMDPAADFLWRALPCGGPEVAAFICELPIPSWALGPKGCLLTELPSLTVLYVPEQSALELTSDCGLDGTKRIACKGNADHEEMLKQLTCVIPNEDMDDDKSTKTSTSDYVETSTWEDNSIGDGKTTKSWTSNTIIGEYGTPTRHRRETEDSLSPVSTKSSFKEVPTSDLSWQGQHKEKTVLTTEHLVTGQEFTTSPATVTEAEKELNMKTEQTTTAEADTDKVGNNGTIPGEQEKITSFQYTSQITTEKSPISDRPSAATIAPQTADKSTAMKSTPKQEATTESASTTTPALVEGSAEDYPSAINQGQLFSIIENGTMFDLIELNETEQHTQTAKTSSSSSIHTEAPTILSTTEKALTKKPTSKKPIQPAKKVSKVFTIQKTLTTENPTTKHIQSVDEMEENLTKEFEMMPDIKDNSPRLNRTFRKELPPATDEQEILEDGGQYGVPRILNFTIVNGLDEEGYQGDQPQNDGNDTATVVISDKVEPIVTVTSAPKPLKGDNGTEIGNGKVHPPGVKGGEPAKNRTNGENIDVAKRTVIITEPPPFNPVDPRIYMINHHLEAHPTNHSTLHLNHSTVHPATNETNHLVVEKRNFLPKSLLGEQESSSTPQTVTTQTDSYSEHPFPSDEPKKINRHRTLAHNKGRKFYPYFFSRMLG